jgi:hypothetical protein
MRPHHPSSRIARQHHGTPANMARQHASASCPLLAQLRRQGGCGAPQHPPLQEQKSKLAELEPRRSTGLPCSWTSRPFMAKMRCGSIFLQPKILRPPGMRAAQPGPAGPRVRLASHLPKTASCPRLQVWGCRPAGHKESAWPELTRAWLQSAAPRRPQGRQMSL